MSWRERGTFKKDRIAKIIEFLYPLSMSFGSQLLALRIDEQLQGIFVRYIAQFQSNNALYQPEYETIIAILYYALSLATRRPTPGMQTLKLQLNSHEQHKPQWLFLW
jgi:hypothetical protein